MTESQNDFDEVCARAGFADLLDIVDAPGNVENAGAVGTGEGDPNDGGSDSMDQCSGGDDVIVGGEGGILTLSCDQLQTAAAKRAAEITELQMALPFSGPTTTSSSIA